MASKAKVNAARGGDTNAIHGRSRMTIDPRSYRNNARTELVGFSPTTGRHCVHQARSAVGCLASRMKGYAASY